MQSEKLDIDALELVGVFGRASNFPKNREGIQFLAQGLAKACKASGVEMSAIVDRCTEISGFCPTDNDLLRVAEEIRVERKEASRPKAPLGCALCQGSGWQSFQRHVDPINDGVGYMADYADFCVCARGQWIRQCEKDRKAEAAAKKTKGKRHYDDSRDAA